MVGSPYSPFRVFHRTIGCILAVLIVAIVSACGSTSTESLVGPGGPKCAVSLTGPSDSISASGGAGTVAVNTQPECEWTASADASWLTGLAPTTGQGSGEVQFQVVANPNGTARQSAVTINGQRAVIQQNAAACELTATASNSGFPASGGSATISIAVPAACPWTASSNVSWIGVSPASGSGSANIGFTVAVNSGAARTGTVTAGGVSITVGQSAAGPAPAPSCSVSLQQSSTSIPGGGGSGTIGITANAGCPWTASSTVSWITLTTTNGSGNGSVGFTVAANTASASRTGSVNISGATFTVNQAGTSAPCTVTINPTSQSVPAAGANVNVGVSASGSCAWTATSNAAWLSITAGAAGSGNGTVTVTAAVNTGTARTGTVTIGGQTFTANQAAAAPTCTYSINPTSITVGSDKVSGLTVAVTAGAGCSWNATSQAGWLHISGTNSGSGNGTVTYNVDDAKNPPRTGTLTIAGQTLTVTQVQCSTTLNPQTQSVPVLGGSFTVSVNTQIGCDWQAVESLSWVTVTSGTSGTGTGTVGYTVAPNVAGARSGTVAIGGQTLTINQAAVLP